jgi:phosphatidylglycerol---prolipoprotein diacylglyceryl transferase
MIRDPAIAALTHALFEYGGIALGVLLYRRARQRSGLPALTAAGSFALFSGLLLGAAIGNKAVFAIERPDLIAAWWAGGPLVLGQSIVGGLLGGLIGIELAKALTGQRASTGDLMVTPIIAGLMLGRVGCFLAGLHDDTHGLPTALPWGVDQGDGVPRHPSALYEIAFLAALGTGLHHGQARWAAVPGLRFKLFLSAYLLWRLIGDSLKPVRVEYAGGLSGIQWVCALALLAYAPLLLRAWGQRRPALAA